MSKQVILLKDVEGLGIVGDVVKVADGHARNYLFPQRLATLVSPKVIERLAEARARREAELLEEKNRAESVAATIDGKTVTIKVKTSGEGRLYGSVAAPEIAEAAKAANLHLEVKHIHLGAPFRQLGSYEVRIRLHRDVAVTLKVDVVSEDEV